jgi:hypothetical protein
MLDYKCPIPIKYKSKYATNREPTGIYQEMQTWLLNLDKKEGQEETGISATT